MRARRAYSGPTMGQPGRARTLRSRLAAALFVLAGSASAGPCITADAACTEWVVVGEGSSRLLVYRSHSMQARNENITRALVVVHGRGRDADDYFRHALAGAFLAGALDDTLVVAPRFAANDGADCRDTLAPDELNWDCELSPEGWRAGGAAVDNGQIAAFDAMDAILRKLAHKESLPKLRQIVVAGHSAGGLFVQRYQLTNRVHDSLGVAVTYVVANPSSYAYLDRLRPTRSAVAPNVAAAAPGYSPPPPAAPPAPFAEFTDAHNCTTYDQWPYGLERRTGYVARINPDEIGKHLAARPATYLLGELDILPLYGFDASCPAQAQGPTRLARGLAYAKYARERYGARHDALVIPACGHNARCMFTAGKALPVLFPRP